MTDQMLGGLLIVVTVVGTVILKRFFGSYPLPGRDQKGDGDSSSES